MARRGRFRWFALLVPVAAVALAILASARRSPDRSSDRASEPKRLVSLCVAATETIVALGLTDRLVGVDRHSVSLDVGEIPVLGSGATLSSERLAAASPDLVFAWWFQRGAIEQMERLDIPVVRLRAQTVEEAVDLVARVSEACGVGEAGRTLVRRLRCELEDLERIAAARPVADRPLVYLELHAPFRSCGPGSYGHDLILRVGGRNLAADAGVPYPTISNEVVISARPDVILLVRALSGAAGDVASRPGWSTLPAVKTGRVHVLRSDLLSPGPGVVEAVRRLRELVFPGSE